METKYIVNNLTGQTINGNITINGNLSVTGTTTNEGLLNYKALLTQTPPISGTNIGFFYDYLIIGESYTITNYVAGDDFSNVAFVESGTINETGCVFIATGYTPTFWGNGSELISSGDLVVDVLENSLGYDLDWGMNPYGGDGVYFAFNDTTGPIYNTFERNKTSVFTQLTSSPYIFPFTPITLYAQTGTLTSKDDIVYVGVWDFDSGQSVNNQLYYTPVEIKIKQDTDTTPIVLSGSVVADYPFSYASVDLICDGDYVENFVGDNTTVNNLTELITQLNSDVTTSYLGTYSDDGNGGVLLTIATNLANQFCSDGTLTFEVYSD
jgi:hypothetical protein